MFGSNNIRRNTLIPTFILLFTLVISLLSTASFVAALNTNLTMRPNVVTSSTTTTPTLLDPNPQLIDKHGNLIQNVTLPSNLTSRDGTIADGVSKLIIEVKVAHKDPLNFSIIGKSPQDLSEGTLSPLITSPRIEKPSSSIVVSPHQTNNSNLVGIAVYTPPDFIKETTAAYQHVSVSINDTKNSSISLSPVIIALTIIRLSF